MLALRNGRGTPEHDFEISELEDFYSCSDYVLNRLGHDPGLLHTCGEDIKHGFVRQAIRQDARWREFE